MHVSMDLWSRWEHWLCGQGTQGQAGMVSRRPCLSKKGCLQSCSIRKALTQAELCIRQQRAEARTQVQVPGLEGGKASGHRRWPFVPGQQGLL